MEGETEEVSLAFRWVKVSWVVDVDLDEYVYDLPDDPEPDVVVGGADGK